MEEMKALAERIKVLDTLVREIDEQIQNLLLTIPNTPNELVPFGEDDTQNQEMRKVFEPTTFAFDPKPHWEIGEDLDILDFARASKITGSRFTVYYLWWQNFGVTIFFYMSVKHKIY